MVLSTVMISRGGQESLRLARERLGADIVVVPRGSVTAVEGALLLGNATNTYMPRAVVDGVAAVPGVGIASPQLYLSSMANSSCCSVSLMFMYAFDPATDFTIEPWLKENLGQDLAEGQAVGGSDVFVPEGQDKIKLYGYDFDLIGNLEPTGTNLDQTLFMTFPTAYAMEQVSRTKAKMSLPILENTVSSVMVRVDPGADRNEVAAAISDAIPEAEAVPAAELFSSYGAQISGVLRTLVVIVVLTVALSLALMAVVFWMSVHDRSRQIGVLRALGATQRYVLLAYMTEAALLALAGGLVGAILAAVLDVPLPRPARLGARLHDPAAVAAEPGRPHHRRPAHRAGRRRGSGVRPGVAGVAPGTGRLDEGVTGMTAVALRGVGKSYGGDGARTFAALRDVDLDIEVNDFLVITGRSGCGKTTLLNVAAGLATPTGGTVTVGGVDIWSISDAERSSLRNRTMGFVFQFPSLIPGLSLEQNVMLPLEFSHDEHADAGARARELLDMVGLGDRMAALPRELSAGQQQRVVIARALINRPTLLLADEPSSDLDEQTEAEILEISGASTPSTGP